MKTLIELYKSIAASVGLISDNQGFMSTLLPGSDTPKPWTVDQKRAVLPMDEQLKQHDWSNRIGFHPLLQNLTGGESRVMEKFRDRMNGFADFMFGVLLRDICGLALQGGEVHQMLSPVQASYLGPFKEADGKFYKIIEDLIGVKRPLKKNHEFIKFQVIKGRVWQGQKRKQVAVMHFPLYEQLPEDNKGATILNHKLRQKDVRMLREMYEFLFPHINEKNYYEIGSDSVIGPSIEALMAIYGVFVETQNKAVDILKNAIKSGEELYIVDDWREDILNVEKLLPEIRRIPMLEGNTPSERIMQAAAPQRVEISINSPVAQPVTPTLSVNAGAQIDAQINQQQVNQMYQNNPSHPKPRIKLGIASPTVETVNPAHQLPTNVGNDQHQSGQTIGYARPAPSTFQPTPPVGAALDQQRQAQGLPPLMGTNVLNNQQVVQQAPVVQATKIPDAVRMVGNQMYIPLETNGVSAAPAGMILIEGKPYVPFGGVGAAGVGQVNPMMANRGMVGGIVGMQQQITHPSQVPGLTAEEVQFYTMNPVMFQNLLQSMQVQTMAAANNVLATRQQQVPRYLQAGFETAQQQQQQQQQSIGLGSMMTRRIGGLYGN